MFFQACPTCPNSSFRGLRELNRCSHTSLGTEITSLGVRDVLRDSKERRSSARGGVVPEILASSRELFAALAE